MQIKFVIGTGRSGTFALAKAFELFESIAAHHEFNFEPVLQQAILFRLGRRTRIQVRDFLLENYRPAILAAGRPCWVDCSNALPWLIEPLAELFPEAEFVFVSRHGKRVVSSFFHKFTQDMYADECVAELQAHLRGEVPEPPPLKRYWRPVPLPGDPLAAWFDQADRFGRLCYYWTATNDHTLAALAQFAPNRHAVYGFESILADPAVRFRFLTHFPLPPDGPARIESFLQRPINVAEPVTYPLTAEQDATFGHICGGTMGRLGYDVARDYSVKY
jgi:hypothetical protein